MDPDQRKIYIGSGSEENISNPDQRKIYIVSGSEENISDPDQRIKYWIRIRGKYIRSESVIRKNDLDPFEICFNPN